MNIAFSAILALVLIVPGLIFLRVRRRSPDEIVVMLPAPQPLSIEALLAMVFATTLHIAWYALVCYPMRRVLGLDVDLATIVMLLIGKYGANDADFALARDAIAGHPFAIASYFLGLYAFSTLISIWAGDTVDCICAKWRLIQSYDTQAQEWRKFLKAKAGHTALVTAVVEMGGVAYLFLGELRRLYFDPVNASLDRLELMNVYKRPLIRETPDGQPAAPPADEDDFKEVFGHGFLLRYSEIKTFNVIFVDQTQTP